MKVYFIPGLGAKSTCFKYITLPEGFEKACIDWHTPKGNETLEEYTRKMAEAIDTTEPFVLVGYSFGGVIVQEMNRFLKPEKIILIASMRNNEQIPNLFKLGKAVHFTKWFPMGFFTREGVLSYSFARTVYRKTERGRSADRVRLEEFMMELTPVYLRWSMHRITHWRQSVECPNLYQIHGTKDIIFPYRKIEKDYALKKERLYTIEGANHILVLEAPKKVSRALENILLDKNSRNLFPKPQIF